MPKPSSAISRESSIRRAAKHVLIGGLAILTMKFGLFALTNSTAVLADAMESIVNLIAAIIMLYGVWMMQRPGDENRPTQHSKTQYMMIGFEGWLILIIGAIVGYISVNRLIQSMDTDTPLELDHLQLGIWFSGGIALLTTILAFYILNKGKKLESQVLIADGKHLLADVASTLGVIVGLSIVNSHSPNNVWIDPVVALIVTAIVLYTSWRLMWKSVTGLAESYEQEIDPTIATALDGLIKSKTIAGYEQVRYRFNGPHRWVELTALVDPAMTILDGRKVASKTSDQLLEQFEDAQVIVNIDPYEGVWPPEAWAAAEAELEAEKAREEAGAVAGEEAAEPEAGLEPHSGEDAESSESLGNDKKSDAEEENDTYELDDAVSELKPAADDIDGVDESDANEPENKNDVDPASDADSQDEEPERRFGDDLVQ